MDRSRHAACLMVLALSLAWFTPQLEAAPVTQTLSLWQGEYLDSKDGAFYLVLDSKNFNPPLDAGSRALIAMVSILTNEQYVASQKLDNSAERMMPVWKVPSGKYYVAAVIVIDGKGRKRTWHASPNQKVSFSVKRLYMSNIGIWTLSPGAGDALNIDMKVGPNIYKENPNKTDSSIAGVINGFNGLEQELFGGKALLKKAEDNYGTPGEMRASYTIHRQIAMFFTLNLFKDNSSARSVADMIKGYDPPLRNCYTDRLDERDGIRGSVQFKFVLSKPAASMRSLKHAGGTLSDPPLVKCLFEVLEGASFPVQSNMIGELTLTFDVK